MADAPPPRPEPALLRSQYTAAWGEISARIAARDAVLTPFILSSGTIFLAASRADGSLNILLHAIPHLALATLLLQVHHDLIIGKLAVFLARLRAEWLASRPEDRFETDWYMSPAFYGKGMLFRMIRDLGFLLVYFVNGGMALMATGFPGKVTGWHLASLGSLAAVLAITASVWSYRRRMYSQLREAG